MGSRAVEGALPQGTLLPFSRFDVVFIVSSSAAFIALNLHDIRYWLYAWIGDEWQFFDAARVIARGNPVDMLSQNGVDFIFPVVNSAYQSLFMHVVGINVVGWRLSSIISAAFPVTVLYWLGKQFGGVPFAIAASGFYLSCDLLWAFAHIGYNNNDALLAMVPAAALFYAAMQSNRLSLMFAAGAACGAGWYTIYTARLMIGILGLILLIDLFRSPRATIQRIIFLVGGFLMVALPLLLDSGWDVLRTMSHNTPGDLGDNPYSLLLPRNIVRALYEFFYNTSTNHYITGAIFTQIAAAALAIGIAISLRGLGTTAVRLMLLWFVVTLLLTTPLNDAAGVSFTRSMIIVPPASLLAALGLCSVARALQRISPRVVSAAIFPLVIASTLSGAAALDGYRFFVTMPRLMYANDLSMVIGVLTAHPDTTAVLAGQMANSSICIVLDGYGITDARVLRFNHGALARLCGDSAGPIHAGRDPVLILVNASDRTTLAPCGARLIRLLQAPNPLSAIYGLRVQASPDPVATYLTRAAAAARQACPLVAGLPAN
ncbi:MAG TPA: glycosyltransferase family 39 protein [Chloroflexota bacterium]